MEYQFIISGEIGVSFDWYTGQRGTTVADVKNFLDHHKGEDVDIAICSPGGYVDAGLTIYNLISEHGGVHAHIIGLTASAATALAMGAKTVDMVLGSSMMIHNVSTVLDVWQAANKEQMDVIIAEFQKERADLDTFDKIIASIYAKKSGKPLEDCQEKMKKAAWLTPQDALDFGLIDSIRDDAKAVSASNHLRTKFTNSIFKDFGLPSLPAATAQGEPSGSLNSVVDGEGNPADSFMQKASMWLQKRFPKLFANDDSAMKKAFTCLIALLAVNEITVKDGKVELTEDQAGKIEDQLATLEQKLKDAETAKQNLDTEKQNLQTQLAQAQKDITDRDAQIEALKKAPGAEDNGSAGEFVNDEVDHKSNRQLFNAVMGQED